MCAKIKIHAKQHTQFHVPVLQKKEFNFVERYDRASFGIALYKHCLLLYCIVHKNKVFCLACLFILKDYALYALHTTHGCIYFVHLAWNLSGMRNGTITA